MATVGVRIVILTVQITLSVCPFNRMAHTANRVSYNTESLQGSIHSSRQKSLIATTFKVGLIMNK
jgi:hypothetical protein